MRKLEDIPKKSVFKVPDGYFDQLPTTIQARMAATQRSTRSTFSVSLKYALPAMAIVVAASFWLRPEHSLEEQLDEIDSDQIAFYLETTERADLDEAHDPAELTELELDMLKDAVNSNMEYNKFSEEELLDELDLDNL